MFGTLPPNSWGSGKPLLGTQALRNGPLFQSLVDEWLLNETAGSKIRGVNGLTGTLNSGVTWVEGPRGKCLKFDGSTGKVEFAYTPGSIKTVSMGGWIKPVATFYGIVLDCRSVSGGEGYASYVDKVSGKAAINANTSGSGNVTLSGTTNVYDGAWHHIAGTFDGSTAQVYCDGKQEASTSIAGFSFVFTPTLARMAEDFQNNVYPGQVDWPFLYNRKLSGDEVREIYLRGARHYANPTFQRWFPNPSIMKAQGRANASAGPGYAGTAQGQASASGSAGTTKSNSLQIDGVAALSASTGQSYVVSTAIQGTSAISQLVGFGYALTISIDGDSSVAVSELYIQEYALSIDGVSACVIAVEYHGNALMSVDGVSAATISETVSSVNFATVACGATIGVENIYNILYDTNAVSGFSASVDAVKSNAETPAAQGQFDAVCTGVFGRTVAQGLAITQFATYKRPTGIAVQTLSLSQSVVVRAVHIEVVAQTLSMTQSAYAARSAHQTLALSQFATCVRVRSASVHQTLAMTQSGTRTTVLARTLSQTLVLNVPRQVAAPIIGSSGGGDQTQFQYAQPLVSVALRTKNCLVVIGTPAQTVVLPCPLFGDAQHYTGTVDLKKTMTGDTFTYVRRTGTEVLKYSFNLGTYKAIELRDFLLAHSHELITLHNWKGETWYAFLTNNPFEFVHAARWQPLGERVDITLEFEGIRR